MPRWSCQRGARVNSSACAFCSGSSAREDREGLSRRVAGQQGGLSSSKITEKAYVDKCRAGEAVALPTTPAAAPTPAAPAPTAAAPTPAPTQAAPAPAPTPAPAVKPSQTAATPSAGADQFQTEAQAKSHCPADLVVWANLTSKIYHFAGHKSYGTMKSGAYMCEKEATAHGFRASKTEKRPSAKLPVDLPSAPMSVEGW